jgi:site-specific DNA recombinase
MKAAIYARFSTDKQSDSSIEDQARNCEQYAQRCGMTITARFEDRAISGSSKDRPGFDAMLAAAGRGEFDVLLVDDLSRLSRDDIQMKQVIRRFKFKRVRIVGVSDGYDSDTKGEKIQSTMRGLMNEMFLDDLREKTHRGLYGKALNGFSAGGRTYGYKRAPIESQTKLDANGRPEIEAVRRAINEDEAKWVRQIFEWFAQGNSPKTIADKLNRLGVRSTRGSTWAGNAIYGNMSDGTELLKNELYIGRYIWNRCAWVKDPDTGRRRKRKRDQSEWVITELPELRIVSQELWEKVKIRQNEIRAQSAKLREVLNNPQTRSRSGKFLFSGLLQCGCCGSGFSVCSATSYGCSTNLNRGCAACPNKLRISRKLLEEKLLEVIKEELLSDEAIDLFIQETTEILKERKAQQDPERELHQLSINQAERQIANIMKAIKAGIVTPTTKSELERAEADLIEAKAALEEAAGISELLTTVLPNAGERYRTLVKKLGETLYTDVPHARQCLKAALGLVRLIPSKAGGYLEAELRHNPEGLMLLALEKDAGLKVRVVAGAGFEPATFRL